MSGVDFALLQDRARGMSEAALRGALRDIELTLPHADALDRALGGDRGGRYRDQAWVYRVELARRMGMGLEESQRHALAARLDAYAAAALGVVPIEDPLPPHRAQALAADLRRGTARPTPAEMQSLAAWEAEHSAEEGR